MQKENLSEDGCREKMHVIETIHWHTLHPRFLGARSHVLDLGANYGHFAQAITRRFNCQCVAVEPSPEPFASIEESPQIAKLHAAVAEKSGTMPFHIAANSVASSLVRKDDAQIKTIEVRVFSLADLLETLAWQNIDLIKIDIEGAEIGLLNSCPDEVLQRVAQFSVEFHDFCGISSAVAVKATLGRLHDLGFSSVRMSRKGHQDTWLINRRALDISTMELEFIRYVVRNWMGFKRVVKRYAAGYADA